MRWNLNLEKSSSKINDKLIEVFQQCSGGCRPDAAMKPSCGASQIFMGCFFFGLFVPTISSFPHFQIPGCLCGLGLVSKFWKMYLKQARGSDQYGIELFIPLVDMSVRHTFVREHLSLKVIVEKADVFMCYVFCFNRVGLMSWNRK